MSEKVFRLTINIIRNEKGMFVIDDLKKLYNVCVYKFKQKSVY